MLVSEKSRHARQAGHKVRMCVLCVLGQDDLEDNAADNRVSFLSMTAADGSQPSPFRGRLLFIHTPQ